MTTDNTPQPVKEMVEEARKTFTQDTSGEKVDGYLRYPAGTVGNIPHVKICTPNDIVDWLTTEATKLYEAGKAEGERSANTTPPQRMKKQYEIGDKVGTIVRVSEAIDHTPIYHIILIEPVTAGTTLRIDRGDLTVTIDSITGDA